MEKEATTKRHRPDVNKQDWERLVDLAAERGLGVDQMFRLSVDWAAERVAAERPDWQWSGRWNVRSNRPMREVHAVLENGQVVKLNEEEPGPPTNNNTGP